MNNHAVILLHSTHHCILPWFSRWCVQYVEECPYASFVYDAVWVFAKGLQNLLSTYPAALDTLSEEKTTK